MAWSMACRGAHRFFPFFPVVLRNIRNQPTCKNYTKKVKGRRKELNQSNVDIEGILRGSAKTRPSTSVQNAKSAGSSRDAAIQQWQTSQERTSLLRQGEKRVAIIAVITMIVGFAAIKLMVYAVQKTRAYRNRDAVEEQPT